MRVSRRAAQFALAGLGLAVAGTGGGFLRTAGAAPPRPSPGAGPAGAVSAVGVIEPGEGVVKVAAPRYLGPSIVRRLLVAEGDTVAAGAPLAELDSHERLRAALVEAEREHQAAVARKERAERMQTSGEVAAQEARVRSLAAELAYRESEARRARALHADGLLAASEAESVETQRQAKAEELAEARDRLTHLRESWSSELRVTSLEVERTEATRRRAAAELALATVNAPIAGRVLKLHAREGEAVLDKGLLELGDTARMYAVAEVYQADAPRVRVGARARVAGEGVAGELAGVVERVGLSVRPNTMVNPDLDQDVDARVVEVRIRLQDPARAAGLTNMRVSCVIEP